MRTSEDIRRENAKYILETQFQGVKNRMASAVGVPHMTKIATLNQEQRRAVESVVDAMIMKYKSD